MKSYTFGFFLGLFCGAFVTLAILFYMRALSGATPLPVQTQLTHVDALGHVQGATAPLVYLWYAGSPPLVHIAYSSDVLGCNGFDP